MKILVLDDEPALRSALGRAFRALGHEALLAADRSEALAMAPQAQAALLDYMAGAEDGLAIAHELQAEWPQLKIAMMTGMAIDSAESGPAGGHWKWMRKPLSMQALKAWTILL